MLTNNLQSGSGKLNKESPNNVMFLEIHRGSDHCKTQQNNKSTVLHQHWSWIWLCQRWRRGLLQLSLTCWPNGFNSGWTLGLQIGAKAILRTEQQTRFEMHLSPTTELGLDITTGPVFAVALVTDCCRPDPWHKILTLTLPLPCLLAMSK